MMVAIPFDNLGTPSVTDVYDVTVTVNGIELAGAAAACLQDVTVAQTLDKAAQLTLRVAAWDSDTDELTWVDDDTFAPGSPIEVTMGYLGNTTLLFAGDITALDFEAGGGERAVLTVTAYDVLHRLGRGTRSFSYKNKTYAQIASQLATEHDLAADTEESDDDPTNDVVNQENQSDLDFLLGLAKQIGFELYASGKTLVFRKSHYGDTTSVTLDATDDLVQFSAQLRPADQFGGVDVVGFDSDGKKRITASADNPDSSDDAFGDSRLRIDVSTTTQDQANARRDAELVSMRRGALTATGSCFGNTAMRPGLMIEIDGLGQRFGGVYYTSTVTHAISASGGFRTRFTLEGQLR